MKTKSADDLKRSGQYRGDRHGKRGDIPTAPGRPRKPAWVKNDPVANGCWDTIVKHSPPGMLAQVDSLLIASAARWFSVWRRFDEQLAQGNSDAYKLTVQASAAFKQFMAAISRLGIAPVDRLKKFGVSTPEKRDDGKSEFFKVVG